MSDLSNNQHWIDLREANIRISELEAENKRLAKDRDNWRADRDRCLREQMTWMEAVEAVFPDHEYDFFDSLKKIIAERAELEAENERLKEELKEADEVYVDDSEMIASLRSTLAQVNYMLDDLLSSAYATVYNPKGYTRSVRMENLSAAVSRIGLAVAKRKEAGDVSTCEQV